MIIDLISKEPLNEVTYEALVRWLVNEGWSLHQANIDIDIYTIVKDGLKYGVWVPKQKFGDYYLMIDRVFIVLTKVYECTRLQILFELGVVSKQDIRKSLEGLI